MPTRPPRPPSLSLPGQRRRYGGLLLSTLVHGALLGLLIGHGERIWSRSLAPGDPALSGGGGGGGGGSRVAYITLPPVRAPQAPRVADVVPPPVAPPKRAPVPVPAVTPPPIIQRPRPADTTVVAAAPASQSGNIGPGTTPGEGGGIGAGTGPGTGTGAGPGAGPGTGGEGGSIRPPELRDLAFPFETPPKELRGASLDVTFWVRVDGRVERYEVNPEITDQDYARKFDEVIRAFRFTPARAPDGSRVAGTTTVTFTLPGKRSS